MKVLYINLDKDVERRRYMENQLAALGFRYERVSGVDGRALLDTEVNEMYESELSIKYNKKDLTRGEIGCALSHKHTHQIALGHDYTLILEDDIELPQNFKHIIECEIVKNQKNKSWEYLQFNYPPTGLIFIIRWLASAKLYFETHVSQASFIKKFLYLGYSLLKLGYIIPLSLFECFRDWLYKKLSVQAAVSFYRPLYFAGCYIVTKDGAQKLLGLESKIIFAADRIQNQARIKSKLIIRVFCPLVVSQNWLEYGSSILNKKFK